MSAKPPPRSSQAPATGSARGRRRRDDSDEAREARLVAKGILTMPRVPGGVTIEFLDSLGPPIHDPAGTISQALLDERRADTR